MLSPAVEDIHYIAPVSPSIPNICQTPSLFSNVFGWMFRSSTCLLDANRCGDHAEKQEQTFPTSRFLTLLSCRCDVGHLRFGDAQNTVECQLSSFSNNLLPPSSTSFRTSLDTNVLDSFTDIGGYILPEVGIQCCVDVVSFP